MDRKVLTSRIRLTGELTVACQIAEIGFVRGGQRKARESAQKTIAEVRQAIGLQQF